MPSKLKTKRKKRKDYYASKKKINNADGGVPVSKNPDTDSDDENTGNNFTNCEFLIQIMF